MITHVQNAATSPRCSPVHETDPRTGCRAGLWFHGSALLPTKVNPKVNSVSDTNTSPTASPVTIPADLLPQDGRFGCGPSKVRPEQVAYLASLGTTVLGTSHRQAPVRQLVRRGARRA